MEKAIKLSALSSLTERLRVQEKKINGVEVNEDKDLTEDSRTVKQLILMTQTKPLKKRKTIKLKRLRN
jgi:carboxyl-terminal processing protease